MLRKLRHQHIVELHGHGADRRARRPSHGARPASETLAQRLRAEGRLHVDLLQRFGEDLLQTVAAGSSSKGIPHRDIKPDNIGVAPVGPRRPAAPRALRLLALADAGRAHPRRHRALPRPVPVAAEAAALGPPRRALRRGHDALRDGDGHAAALGRRPERPRRARLRGHARRRAVRPEPARAARRLLPQGAPARLPRSASTTPRRCSAPGGSAFARVGPARRSRPTTAGAGDLDVGDRTAPRSTRRSPRSGSSTRAINALERVNAARRPRISCGCPSRSISHMRGVGNKTRRELLEVDPQAGGPLPGPSARPDAGSAPRTMSSGAEPRRVERRPARPPARADARGATATRASRGAPRPARPRRRDAGAGPRRLAEPDRGRRGPRRDARAGRPDRRQGPRALGRNPSLTALRERDRRAAAQRRAAS